MGKLIRAVIAFALRMLIGVIVNAFRPKTLIGFHYPRRVFLIGDGNDAVWEFVYLESDEWGRQAEGLRHRHWLEDYD